MHPSTTQPKRVAQFLDALIVYWLAASNLVQRQEHASSAPEPLGPEDARRVVLQTILVMYEVDRAFARS